MKINKVLKVKMGIVFCFTLILGCAVNRSMLVTDDKVTSKGLYEVSSLSPEWKIYDNKSVHTENNRGTIRDIYYTKCPGPKIIVISRAVYMPPLFGREKSDMNSFEGVALAYLDEFFKGKKFVHGPEKVFDKKIIIEGNVAVEAMYKTKELFTYCSGDENEKADILNKFVVIKGGDQTAFWSWGAKITEIDDVMVC